MSGDRPNLSAEENDEIRRSMLKQFRDSGDADDFKDLNATIIYNYIWENGRIFAQIISSTDL